MLTGLIYQNKERKAYEDLIIGFQDQKVLANQDLKLVARAIRQIGCRIQIIDNSCI